MFGFVWFLLLFIIKFIFYLAFIYSFLTHFMLWLELRTKQLQGNPRFKTLPLKALFFNFLKEGACHFICVFFYPFAKWSPKTQKNRDGVPVLLIPGYLHCQHDFLWFRHHLEAIEGIGSVYSMNLLPYKATLNDHAKSVKQKIAEIKMQTGHRKVILIGHSRGGLVASLYAEFFAAATEEIAAIIGIGTPFRGTKNAVLGSGQSAKELTVNSPLLSSLSERIQHSKIDYYYIASELDNMILPEESAFPLTHLNDTNTFILKESGHLSMLISRPILNQIAEWVLKINP